MKIDWIASPTLSAISSWKTDEMHGNGPQSSKSSMLTVPQTSTEQDRKYTCKISSVQQNFTTSSRKEFSVDLKVYGKLSVVVR